MRKRNYTVTIRMNKAEYDLLQNKVKESGQTQQAVVIHAIAGLKNCIRRGSGRIEKAESECLQRCSASFVVLLRISTRLHGK